MRRRSAATALLAWLVPALALGHEVLPTVEQGRAWAMKIRYADGEALAYVPFEVYSPADPKIPYLKGRTDRSGYLAFVPDVPGPWRVKVIDDTGHGLDTTIEVGSAAAAAGPPAAATSDAGFALRPLVGAAAIGVVFAALFFLYRRKGAKP
ncbi:MAG TPA: hypothetical protein VGK67_09160 [Myxococcales bacterium]